MHQICTHGTYLERDHPDTFSRPAQKHLSLFPRRPLTSRCPPASRVYRLPRHLAVMRPPPAGAAAGSCKTCHAVELRGETCFGFRELQACGPRFLLPFEDGACPVASEKDGEGSCFPVEFSSTSRCLIVHLDEKNPMVSLSERSSIPLIPVADGRVVCYVSYFSQNTVQQYWGVALKTSRYRSCLFGVVFRAPGKGFGQVLRKVSCSKPRDLTFTKDFHPLPVPVPLTAPLADTLEGACSRPGRNRVCL